MYEEEVLFQDHALWWSPDSSRIAFLSFDDSLVDTYPLPIYNPTGKSGAIVPFTSENTMRYPTPGHNNPIASAHILNLRFLDPSDASSSVTDLDWEGRFQQGDSILFHVAWVGNATLLLKESNRNSDGGNVVVFNLDHGTFHGGVVRKLGKNGEVNDDGWIDNVGHSEPTRPALAKTPAPWTDAECSRSSRWNIFPGPKRSRVLVTFFAFPSAKNLIFHQSVTCHNVTS